MESLFCFVFKADGKFLCTVIIQCRELPYLIQSPYKTLLLAKLSGTKLVVHT